LRNRGSTLDGGALETLSCLRVPEPTSAVAEEEEEEEFVIAAADAEVVPPVEAAVTENILSAAVNNAGALARRSGTCAK